MTGCMKLICKYAQTKLDLNAKFGMQEQEFAQHLMLEATSIMTNIACGPAEVSRELLFDSHPLTYNKPSMPSAALSLVIQGLNGTSIELLQICVWFVMNVTEESAEIGRFFIMNSNMLLNLHKLCFKIESEH